MIVCPSITKRSIRHHYELATPFYRLLWGRHIHHGLWQGEEPPAVAQQRLTDHLAAAAALMPGQKILDVGCGVGGSSIDLARRYRCITTGLTLSTVQRNWAALAAWRQGVSSRTRFLRADAETITFPPASFDVVWIIECSEHFFDKAGFFRRAAAWLQKVQQPSGGWGETCRSYDDPSLAGQGVATASQTAWALLALLAAGEKDSDAVRAGVAYLLRTQGADGNWRENFFTGTGFPKVFYLKYHLYRLYFPLMALARYEKAINCQSSTISQTQNVDSPPTVCGYRFPPDNEYAADG